MAFLPDGRLLVTEQLTGRVRMVVNGHVAATDPVLQVANVLGNGEAVCGASRSIPDGRRGPLSTSSTIGTAGTACSRYTARGDTAAGSGENLTLHDPVPLIDDIVDQDARHNAGCLRFGSDGRLFLSLGDDQVSCGAADSTSLRGQLLRLDVDRVPDSTSSRVLRALITPPDNPLSTSDSNARLVWAYGFRKPVAIPRRSPRPASSASPTSARAAGTS